MSLLFERGLLGGTQEVYRFANGYGASVISHQFSYGGDEGLFELAVLKFFGDSDKSFELCYDTEITDDVIGRLTVEDVQETLKRIEQL